MPFVRASDGVAIAYEECGPADASPLVFVHGLAQSRASFQAVLEGPLAADHRLVAIDLRGHGESDDPASPPTPADARLGEDLHTVIRSLELRAPVIVAWSYGGVVVGDYLRRHGSTPLGGILLVAAAVQVGKPARALFGPTMMDNARALLASEPAVYADGARAFLRGCTAAPLTAAVVERHVAAMLRVRVETRRALLGRSDDFSLELSRCEAPLATLHGTADTVVLPAMSEHIRAVAPTAQRFVVDGVGHLSWLESPSAFNAAVLAVVARRSRNARPPR